MGISVFNKTNNVHAKGGKVPMNSREQDKGFTIIEVVLVLAIAGLIFLMVFFALPALQRNQRDAQRRTDVGRLLTALTSYTSNNRGSIPSASGWSSFASTYLATNGDTFIDPSGPSPSQGSGQSTYLLTSRATAQGEITDTFANAQNVIYYTTGAVCSTDNGAAVTAAGARKVAFRIVLEGGGVYCVNN